MFWTVKELMEELSKYDEDLDVEIEFFEGYTPIEKIAEIEGKVVLQPPL